ncbi:hypothetical protein Q7C36_019234 [Tachysurus vachellii]|uniref:Uncharacterized protein n=1 Tax=Tachysurus vachellii TaxID=175792 RepID=A0AA88LXS8_TACVA|nr:hypothetical protein Q7C36_019234 [Tachysurus vachellii]
MLLLNKKLLRPQSERRGEREIEKNKRVSLAFFLEYTKLANTEIVHFSPRNGVKSYRRYHHTAIRKTTRNIYKNRVQEHRALNKTPP